MKILLPKMKIFRRVREGFGFGFSSVKFSSKSSIRKTYIRDNLLSVGEPFYPLKLNAYSTP